MTLILDAGALLAYERGNRLVVGLLERAARNDVEVHTTTGVIAQVWRNDARQARTALLLRGISELELSSEQARRIGVLLAQSGTADIVDGSVVDIAHDGDEILTTDPGDIAALAESSGKNVLITTIT